MTGRTVREAWLAEIMFTQRVNDSCRRVLLCMAMAEDAHGPWMNDRGRVRPIKHKVIGQALTIAEKTVANRILEATRAGLLAKDPTTGYRGRASAYQAMIPAAQPLADEAPISLRALVGGTVKVPVNGEAAPPVIREPFSAVTGPKVPGFGEAQRVCARARATKRNREQKPAPDGSRANGDHHVTAATGAYGSWLPTPLRTSADRRDHGVRRG